MVLRQSSKSLLCGGSLIAPNVVLTSASCVESERPYDLMVKAGEWKLGNDIEPLNPQILTVKRILIHPNRSKNNLAYDLAVLIADKEFQFGDSNGHISPICLEFGALKREEHCVVLGWGEEILKCK